MRNSKPLLAIAVIGLLSLTITVEAKDGDHRQNRGHASDRSGHGHSDQSDRRGRNSGYDRHDGKHAGKQGQHRRDYARQGYGKGGKFRGHQGHYYRGYPRRYYPPYAHYRGHRHSRYCGHGYGGDAFALSVWMDDFAFSYYENDYDH